LEFGEKLQTLRKEKGLTQEELAEALFVSRTAVSKWESGRGYPSIDSIKDIAKFFQVSIDDLLSSEKVMRLAEKENRTNLRKFCDVGISITDVFSILFIFLPLFPHTVDGFIYSVNLLHYTEISDANVIVYFVLFCLPVITGAAKLIGIRKLNRKAQNVFTVCSLGVSIVTVFFLALAREPYASALTFLGFLMKVVLAVIIRIPKKKKIKNDANA